MLASSLTKLSSLTWRLTTNYNQEGIPWLPQESYDKAVGQLRMQIGAVLDKHFHMHGMDMYIPGATNYIVKLAEDFALRCRGVDKPINVEVRSPL